ncbi:hypothetical protein ACF0H5_007514 [Mactra antiquata]
MGLLKLLVLVIVAVSVKKIESKSTPLPGTCTHSSQCQTGECCRDINGYIVGDKTDSWIQVLSQSGTCQGLAGHNEICNDNCGCAAGYVCYRTVTGACCPPKTCWLQADADKDRDHWNNCTPPNCFFPPAANIGK